MDADGSLGTVSISTGAIAQIVGFIAGECYGVVAIAGRGGRVGRLLLGDAPERGVDVVHADDGLAVVTREAARAVVMGARGNAGVILSQIVRGLSAALPAAGPIDAGTLVRACRAGSDAAARAVHSPVEGTMLTVARAAADEAEA